MNDKQFDDCYFDTKTNRITIFPRVGAFEVYINEVLIFSKLRAKDFPKVDSLIDFIKTIFDQFQIDPNKTLEKYDIQNKNIYFVNNSCIFQEVEPRSFNSLRKQYLTKMKKQKFPIKITKTSKLFFPKMDLSSMGNEEDLLNFSSTASSKTKKKPEIMHRNNYILENDKMREKNDKIFKRKPLSTSTIKNKNQNLNKTMLEKPPQKNKPLVNNGPFTIFNSKTMGIKRYGGSFVIFQGNVRRSKSLKRVPHEEKEASENDENYDKNNNHDSTNEYNNIENINENNNNKAADINKELPIKINAEVQFSLEKFKSYINSIEPINNIRNTDAKPPNYPNQVNQSSKFPLKAKETQYSRNNLLFLDKSLETMVHDINDKKYEETQTNELILKDSELQFSQNNFKNYLKTLEPVKFPKECQTKLIKTLEKKVQSKKKKNETIGVQYSRTSNSLKDESVGIFVETRDVATQKKMKNLNKSIQLSKEYTSRENYKRKSLNKSAHINTYCEEIVHNSIQNTTNKEESSIKQKIGDNISKIPLKQNENFAETKSNFVGDHAIESNKTKYYEKINSIAVDKIVSLSNSFKEKHMKKELNTMDNEHHIKKVLVDKSIEISESFKNSEKKPNLKKLCYNLSSSSEEKKDDNITQNLKNDENTQTSLINQYNSMPIGLNTLKEYKDEAISISQSFQEKIDKTCNIFYKDEATSTKKLETNQTIDKFIGQEFKDKEVSAFQSKSLTMEKKKKNNDKSLNIFERLKENNGKVNKSITMSEEFRNQLIEKPRKKNYENKSIAMSNNFRNKMYEKTADKIYENKSITMSDSYNCQIFYKPRQKNLEDKSITMSDNFKNKISGQIQQNSKKSIIMSDSLKNQAIHKPYHNDQEGKSIKVCNSFEKKFLMGNSEIKGVLIKNDKAISMSNSFLEGSSSGKKNMIQKSLENNKLLLKIDHIQDYSKMINKEIQTIDLIKEISKNDISTSININFDPKNINKGLLNLIKDDDPTSIYLNNTQSQNWYNPNLFQTSARMLINQYTQVNSSSIENDSKTSFDMKKASNPTDIFRKINSNPTENSRYSKHKNYEENARSPLGINSYIEILLSDEFNINNPMIFKEKSSQYVSMKTSPEKLIKKSSDFSKDNLEISHGDRIIKSAGYIKPIFYRDSSKLKKKRGLFGSQKVVSSRNILIVLNQEDLYSIETLLEFEGSLINSDIFEKKQDKFKEQVLLIAKEASGIKSIYAFNNLKELKEKIDVHRIDEVFLSNLRELNLIEFQELKENIKKGHIKEILYMDEDFVLGKISQSRSSEEKTSCLKMKKHKSLQNLRNTNDENDLFKWRSSFRNDRFPDMSDFKKKTTEIIRKFVSSENENSLKLSKNKKNMLENRNEMVLDSFKEILKMEFKEFEKHMIENEQTRQKLVILGMKEIFQKSAEEYKSSKMINGVHSSL